MVKSWIDEFPRTFFGFTNTVHNFTKDQPEGLRAVDDEPILLETDAPYFSFPGLKYSAPNRIGMTAAVAAKARNTSTMHLLLVSTVNAAHLYNGGLTYTIYGEVGVIQCHPAAVSVSMLRIDIKRSVSEKQYSVTISCFCDHYMMCSQNARKLNAA